MLVINAFNLIDGVDGLAGSLGLVSCVLFALFFLVNHNFSYAILGFSMAGALLAFLVYNFHPARIFMGDSGSMLIGIVNAVLLLKFINTGSTASDYPMPAAPAIGFGILLIPLMDVARVFCIRIFQNKSPFSPDRNHIHHLLLNKGFSHATVTLVLLGISLLGALCSFIFRQININVLFACQATLFFLVILIFRYPAPSKKSLRVVSRRDDQPVAGKVEVYTLYTPKESSIVKED
jgi:UDP-N-acetylmuramyl pentapeptide phosphotransferase/UDP-N-acetylglucosamine-1-phosphate transferase